MKYFFELVDVNDRQRQPNVKERCLGRAIHISCQRSQGVIRVEAKANVGRIDTVWRRRCQSNRMQWELVVVDCEEDGR